LAQSTADRAAIVRGGVFDLRRPAKVHCIRTQPPRAAASQKRKLMLLLGKEGEEEEEEAPRRTHGVRGG